MTTRILIGDVRERLKTLPADHYDCVVTSPPYWGLRDYGVAGQIGLEPTLGEHLAVMVDVFNEVRRVLKPSGTLWLNYGDCYATTPNGKSAAAYKLDASDDRTFRDKPFSTIGPIYSVDPRSEKRRGNHSTLTGAAPTNVPGRISAGGVLKPKDLCMIPNRLAIALQESGWWVRSEIIWAKPNPMPESIKDRPATAHEKIFMLSKSGRYFYDGDAVKQEAAESSFARLNQDVESQECSTRANGGRKTNGNMKAVFGGRNKFEGFGNRKHAGREDEGKYLENGRNLRNYEPAPLATWVMATAAFADAHFATFPPELVERCLTAGCPAGGKVLDPFGGAGTTALVADRFGLDCDLIELNPAYADITEKRIRGEVPMFAEIEMVAA